MYERRLVLSVIDLEPLSISVLDDCSHNLVTDNLTSVIPSPSRYEKTGKC